MDGSALIGPPPGLPPLEPPHVRAIREYAFHALEVGATAAATDVMPPTDEFAERKDALAGPGAGRAGPFGYVVGVDRVRQSEKLRLPGADVVVADLPDLLGPGPAKRRQVVAVSERLLQGGARAAVGGDDSTIHVARPTASAVPSSQ